MFAEIIHCVGHWNRGCRPGGSNEQSVQNFSVSPQVRMTFQFN
jgi:hypothetical protein